ncbi:MAG: N-acetyltransferase [Phycisphaerales bacterium]
MLKPTPPTFETKRLRVWEVIGVPSEEDQMRPRRMYIATFKAGMDWPGVVVSCSVWPDLDHYVDWIEVIEQYRREGYGKELCLVLRERLGSLDCTGVTESGVALEESLEATP